MDEDSSMSDVVYLWRKEIMISILLLILIITIILYIYKVSSNKESFSKVHKYPEKDIVPSPVSGSKPESKPESKPDPNAKEFDRWNKMVSSISPLPDKSEKDVKDWALRDTDASKVYKTLLKNTHELCVVTDDTSKFSVCVQEPKSNMGYVISVSDKKHSTDIQKSLASSDGVYKIEEFKDIKVLTRNDVPRQVVCECSLTNIRGIMKLVNTKS